MPKKAIKDSKGFIVSWNKRGRKRMFFVRYKDLFRSKPINPIDLPRFLIDKIKEIKKLNK